jgi:hypothetical protein
LLNNKQSEDDGIGAPASAEKRYQRGRLVVKSDHAGMVVAFTARSLLFKAALGGNFTSWRFGDVAGRKSYGKCRIMKVFVGMATLVGLLLVLIAEAEAAAPKIVYKGIFIGDTTISICSRQ